MSDYRDAIWKGSPNFTPSRSGHKIEYISLHIMAGFLAGTDSCFSRPSFGASATYGVGGNGEVHQYVSESSTAWADGSPDSNARSISIEHEGGYATAPCTDACVHASARLCADIARRMGWAKLEHGVNVKLHREIPPYTHSACPDKCVNPLRWEEIIKEANKILGNETSEIWEDTLTEALVTIDDGDHCGLGKGSVAYWSPQTGLIGLPDWGCVEVIQDIHKQQGTKIAWVHSSATKAPWAVRLEQASLNSPYHRSKEYELLKDIQKKLDSITVTATGENPETLKVVKEIQSLLVKHLK